MKTWQNEGVWDRVARLAVGLFLLYLGGFTGIGAPLVYVIVGAVLFLTGLTGFCLIYRLVGISTLAGGYRGPKHHAV